MTRIATSGADEASVYYLLGVFSAKNNLAEYKQLLRGVYQKNRTAVPRIKKWD